MHLTLYKQRCYIQRHNFLLILFYQQNNRLRLKKRSGFDLHRLFYQRPFRCEFSDVNGSISKFWCVNYHQFTIMMLVVQASWALQKSREISPVKFNSWCQILDNLIGWTLTNAGEVMVKLNLSRLQCHPDTHDVMLTPTSYCEPTHIQVLLTVPHVMTCLKVTEQCGHFHTFTTTLVLLAWQTCKCRGGQSHIIMMMQ